jgi:hypothetical protein
MIIWSLSMMKNFALVEDSFIEKGRGAISLSTGSYISLVLPERGQTRQRNSSGGVR